jgi:hypothetical protein
MSDPSDGPVIRIDRRTRNTIRAYASVVTGVMLLLAALSLTGVVHNPNPPSSIAGIAVVTIAGFGVLLFILARSCVVLHEDGIDVTRRLWPLRRVARADIVARRMHSGGWRSAPYHILILRDGSEVSLPPYLEHSTALQDWLRTIPLESKRRRR